MRQLGVILVCYHKTITTTPEIPPKPDGSEESRKQSEVENLVAFIKDQHECGVSAFDFELRLHGAGLLARLEEAGIVPTVECPNPYDPELEEEVNNQWWNEHPSEAEQFTNTVKEREKVMRYLYFGALLSDHLRK